MKTLYIAAALLAGEAFAGCCGGMIDTTWLVNNCEVSYHDAVAEETVFDCREAFAKHDVQTTPGATGFVRIPFDWLG